MRSSCLARVVIAGLAVSLVIASGCTPPTAPEITMPKGPHAMALATVSISPTFGPSAGATVVTISGIEFQSDAIVMVGVIRADATVLNANTISFVMPAHAPGNVDVTVIRAPGLAPVRVGGGYTFVDAPVISELLPNIGSTGGGTRVTIRGTGMWFDTIVKIDGIVSAFEYSWDDDAIYASTPAHAAGTVDVIITDRFGQSASAVFTYASPTTFDFNGDWQGWTGPDFDSLPLVLTVRDNVVVSVSCGSAPSLMLDPPPVVANGEFSFAGSGGVSITGKIVSPRSATGTINMASCVNRQWRADKK